MLTFKLITYEKEVRFGVTILALEAEIKGEYEQDDAKALIRKIHDMMLGSTVCKINDEIAIYPHDIADIFGLFKIPIKFFTNNGSEIAINANGSGIVATIDWDRSFSETSVSPDFMSEKYKGAAASTLKNITTNQQFNDDESMQSTFDEAED